MPSVSIASTWTFEVQPRSWNGRQRSWFFAWSCPWRRRLRSASAATRPHGLPSQARRRSPASSVSPCGARSRNAGSMYRCHRSGGSMMWMSLSSTLRFPCAMAHLLQKGFASGTRLAELRNDVLGEQLDLAHLFLPRHEALIEEPAEPLEIAGAADAAQ